MPSYYWIKLWIDLIDDYRMASLPAHLWRRAIEAFLLARTGGGDGKLPPLTEIAWRLRISPEELEADLTELERTTSCDDRPGIVQHVDNDWLVTNFAKRQKPTSSTKRTQEYRKRKRESETGGTHVERSRDELGTNSSLEEEEDVEVEVEVEVEEKTPTPPPKGGAAGGVITELITLSYHSNTAKELAGIYMAAGALDSLIGYAEGWIDSYKQDAKIDDPVAMSVPQLRAGIPPPRPPPSSLCPDCHIRPCRCEEFATKDAKDWLERHGKQAAE
jgi:hypothetical protein